MDEDYGSYQQHDRERQQQEDNVVSDKGHLARQS